jgi:hypothetical protein
MVLIILIIGVGSGDYLKLKDQLFDEETAASLYLKVLEFQSSKDVVNQLIKSCISHESTDYFSCRGYL